MSKERKGYAILQAERALAGMRATLGPALGAQGFAALVSVVAVAVDAAYSDGYSDGGER